MPKLSDMLASMVHYLISYYLLRYTRTDHFNSLILIGNLYATNLACPYAEHPQSGLMDSDLRNDEYLVL